MGLPSSPIPNVGSDLFVKLGLVLRVQPVFLYHWSRQALSLGFDVPVRNIGVYF